MVKNLLTKSNYLIGLTCPRTFWLLFHEPDKIPEVDEQTQFLFSQGHLVGGMAKKLFQGGVEVPRVNFRTDIKRSQELLAKRRPLFEAGFVNDGCYAKADVLRPVGKNEWDIIEVKSSTKVKEEHIYDLAFQKRCYEGAGVKVRNCYLLHVNGKYEKDGEIELKKFFEMEDISKEVATVKETVEKHLSVLFKIMASEKCPVDRCNSPKGCPVPDECWGDLPDDSVFTLYYAGKKAVELYQSGIVRIQDIPSDYRLNGKQQIQKEALANEKAYKDAKAISSFLSKLKYPLHFLDFETFGTAVPLFKGVRPYQAVPFQFSLHIVEKPGLEPQHYFFLAERTDDPRPALLEKLRKVMKDTGSVVVYNQSFENGVLLDLAKAFRESTKWVQDVLARVVDLLVPFRSFHYYHPEQNGSASIKSVLPALTNNGYSELDIGNGEIASLRYLQMTYLPEGGKLSQAEKLKRRKDLEEYCALDTEGMIAILEELKGHTGEGEKTSDVHTKKRETAKNTTAESSTADFELSEDPRNKLVLYNLQNGIYDSNRFFDLHKRAAQISAIDNFEKLISLDNVKVDLYPHQVDTAYTVVNKLKLSALLADEVGLGKTIEAGIIIKELLSRALVKKILVLVPASLTTQWQDEMKVKFNEDFIRREEFRGTDFWERFDKIISSIDTAKQPENAQMIKNINWDLIIIDEAHKLKNEETLNFQFVGKIPKKYFFMLTATPMQNNLKELYNMFTLLKPGLLGTYSQFQSKFMEDIRTPSNHEELQTILKEVMIRNRRGDVDIKFPARIVRDVSFKLSKDEIELYNELEKFIRAHYSLGVMLVLMILQRVATSSSFAITSTLRRMLYTIENGINLNVLEKELLNESEEDISDVEHVKERLARIKEKAAAKQKKAAKVWDVDWLKRLIAQSSKIRHNTKGDELLKYINTYLKDDKVLIFTSFRKTQDYLFNLFTAEGYKCTKFNGSMNWVDKDNSVAEFKRDAQILISTEAGGEGRNLQFCHVMINYDLPWNPMRIEQRIGRVHRLKQEHDVLIVNFSSKDTIEEYILELLYKKIKLFSMVIGELDTILSNVVDTPKSFEKTILDIVVKSRDKKEMQKKFAALGQNVEKGQHLYDKVKKFDAKVFENFDLTPIYKYGEVSHERE